MPDTFHSLNYHDDRLLNQMREAFLGGVIPSAVQTALDTKQDLLFRQRSITINNSEILTLPSAPVAVVPETETLNYVGKITRLPIIVRGALHWDVWEGTPYGNITAPNLGIFIGNDALGVGPVSTTIDSLTFFNVAASSPLFAFGSGANTPGGNNPLAASEWAMDGSNHDNGLYLGLQFNAGNLTGGHATNRMRVSLVYLIYNLQTGLFE